MNITGFLEWLTYNGPGLGVIVAFIPIAAAILQYIYIKRQETKSRRFDEYHELIKKLNQTDTPGEVIKLYRQVAIVYELRFYSKYRNASIRILKAWPRGEHRHFKALYEEMDRTSTYLERNWIYRFFRSKFNLLERDI